MKKDIKILAALLIASATFVACSSDDDIINETQQPVNPTGKYTMTINASKGDDATTRALALDGKTLSVKWAATDEVSVFPEAWSRTALGTLTAAASENGSTSLTGDLTTAPTAGDKLKLLFPRATWDYTGQKGVLLSDANSIEKKYDYALAEVTVDEVDGNTITTTGDANFASQQAIVKFTLQDKDGNALNATSLTISAASNKLVTGKGFNTISRHSGSYTCDGGTDGYDPASRLVDGNKTNNKWCVGNEHKSGGIWYCEFHTASAVLVDGYQLTTAHDAYWNNRNPKDWVLKAKVNSGDTWTTIATVSNDATLEDESLKSYDFNVDVPGEYQYFRFEVSATRGADVMQLEELELFAKNYGTAYGSLTITPASATSELTVALRNENGSADTYTLSANVGGTKYGFSKSGVTFQNGKYYEITVKMAEQTEWNFSEMTSEHPNLNSGFTYGGVTLQGMGDLNFNNSSLFAMEDCTFTAPTGKHFKKIVINATGMAEISGSGWTNGSTWTGDASTVTIDAYSMADGVTSIVFTLE